MGLQPPRALTRESLRRGAEILAGMDADLACILKRLGVPPLWARRPGFPALVQIILEQQVSLAAARTMYRRLYSRLGGMTAEGVHALQVDGLRKLGLTRQKASYCHGLAAMILSGNLDLTASARAADQHGRLALLSVPGLGPWSVDIYYVTALRRPDVWPRGDLALASALRDVKRMREIPGREEQESLTSGWSPWRSVAARILWAHYLDCRGRYLPRENGDQRSEIGDRRSEVRGQRT
ncbi:MAG: DNA-3-methyladenine glycosylase 2 family protein [Desulfobacteraceae bacterium]|nr:MAG: DNA-3-methyladenine glycosylase 2 family protein [Desulfobacteraceae bacterium]